MNIVLSKELPSSLKTEIFLMLYYGHNFFEELHHGTLPKFSNLSHFLWHNKKPFQLEFNLL